MSRQRQEWTCPRCDTRITTHTPIEQAPTHTCHKSAGRTLPLQEVPA